MLKKKSIFSAMGDRLINRKKKQRKKSPKCRQESSFSWYLEQTHTFDEQQHKTIRTWNKLRVAINKEHVHVYYLQCIQVKKTVCPSSAERICLVW